MNVIWRVKQDNIAKSQDRQKENYDRHNKVQETTLKQGDLVYLKNPSLRSGPAYKLKFEWEGPYEITSFDGANVYIRKCGKPGADTKCVHLSKVSKLKPFARPVEVEQTSGERVVERLQGAGSTVTERKQRTGDQDRQHDGQRDQASSSKTSPTPTQARHEQACGIGAASG